MATPGNPPYIVRPATQSDVASIQSLLEPYFRQRKLLPRTLTELERLAENGFIGVRDDRIVGFAAVEIYSRKMAEIQCLAVSEEMQGQGLGRELVKRCIQCARENKVLELMAITASERFLMECGFHYSLPDQKKALFIQTSDPYANNELSDE